MKPTISLNEFLHYALVFAAIAITWVPLMQVFNNVVWLTIAASFALFIAADKAAHKVLKLKVI